MPRPGWLVEADGPSVALDDDPVRHREALTRALADLLGREERIEDPVGDLGGDSRAAVGDLDDHRVGLGAAGDSDHSELAVAGLADRVGGR